MAADRDKDDIAAALHGLNDGQHDSTAEHAGESRYGHDVHLGDDALDAAAPPPPPAARAPAARPVNPAARPANPAARPADPASPAARSANPAARPTNPAARPANPAAPPAVPRGSNPAATDSTPVPPPVPPRPAATRSRPAAPGIPAARSADESFEHVVDDDEGASQEAAAAAEAAAASAGTLGYRGPTVPARARKPSMFKTIGFRQTAIPILLTTGVMMLVMAAGRWVVADEAPLARIPVWAAGLLIVVGVMLVALGVLNMLLVRGELAAKRP